MKEISVKRYVTEDGNEFENKEIAAIHEAELKIDSLVDNDPEFDKHEPNVALFVVKNRAAIMEVLRNFEE